MHPLDNRKMYTRWMQGDRRRYKAEQARLQALHAPRTGHIIHSVERTLRGAAKALLWFVVACIALTVVAGSYAIAQPIPREAHAYRLTLKREAQQVWGLQAPVAVFAAQVHQESRWRPDAISIVGAQGMAQFMPATAAWWCQRSGTAGTDCAPTNPTWALRALVGYDKFLFERLNAVDDCNRMAFTLSAYNGGHGWVNRDKAKASATGADPLTWFESVEKVNAGRSVAAFAENRAYPRLILQRYAPMYTAANWGQGVCP